MKGGSSLAMRGILPAQNSRVLLVVFVNGLMQEGPSNAFPSNFYKCPGVVNVGCSWPVRFAGRPVAALGGLRSF